MYQKDFPVQPKNDGVIEINVVRISVFFMAKRGLILNATAGKVDSCSFSCMVDFQPSNLLALPMQRKSEKTAQAFVPTEEQIQAVLTKELAKRGLTLA